jgi:hypothetical protein
MRENEVQNQEHLNMLKEYWQEKLKLQAWDIKVMVCRDKELYSSKSDGEIWQDIQSVRATIKLMDPIDANPNAPFPYDMEEVLVHELLHLIFAPFEPKEKSLKHDFWERAIERMAHTLVGLKRERENEVSQ